MTILVKFKCDWADEHDVYGFCTFESRDKLEKVFTYMTAYWEEYPNKEVELGFGTNQYLTLDSIEAYKDCLTIIDLTDEEFKTLVKLFPDWSDGNATCGYTGWYDITDYCGGAENERLEKLFDSLWSPTKW